MATSKERHTYIFRASWRSTALIILVEAVDEETAFDRAYRRKDIKGCLDLTLIGLREYRE